MLLTFGFNKWFALINNAETREKAETYGLAPISKTEYAGMRFLETTAYKGMKSISRLNIISK